MATSTTGAYVRGHEEQPGKAAPSPVAAGGRWERQGANDEAAVQVRHVGTAWWACTLVLEVPSGRRPLPPAAAIASFAFPLITRLSCMYQN